MQRSTLKSIHKSLAVSRYVACNGGDLYGHPKIYLEIGHNNSVKCPYCGKQFFLQESIQNNLTEKEKHA